MSELIVNPSTDAMVFGASCAFLSALKSMKNTAPPKTVSCRCATADGDRGLSDAAWSDDGNESVSFELAGDLADGFERVRSSGQAERAEKGR